MSKLVLLTGFLGAGKTTFLNHVLQEFSQDKVGLIVNEFSGNGVDGALIRHDIPGAKMIELNNGSIFCACIKDSFVDSLIDLAGRNLDYVFVEASGLADPSSISSILDQIATLSGAVYDYCGAICLVDALYFPKYLKLLLALRRQVEYSRAVILNKADLVTEEQLSKVEQSIREINPKAALYRTTYANVSLREILSEGPQEEAAPQESSNTESSRPVTITLSTQEAIPPRPSGSSWTRSPPPPTGSRASAAPPRAPRTSAWWALSARSRTGATRWAKPSWPSSPAWACASSRSPWPPQGAISSPPSTCCNLSLHKDTPPGTGPALYQEAFCCVIIRSPSVCQKQGKTVPR